MTTPSSRCAARRRCTPAISCSVSPTRTTRSSKAAEDKAKAVIARIKKGEDFVKLANELTEDPSGHKDGGDLGYFTKEEMVPEFSTVAFKLDKGKFSDPVKTQFGWHIILVEDKRKRPPPPFDQVKGQLERYRRAQGTGRPRHQAARRRRRSSASTSRRSPRNRRRHSRRRRPLAPQK